VSRIIAFGGKKQSGKSTACTYLSGILLVAFQKIGDFVLTDNGELQVGEEIVPVNDIAPDIVKVYSFADTLKTFCVETLGLSPEQVYGTDAQKNSLTNIKWENVPGCVTNKTLYNWLIKTAKKKNELNSDYKGTVNIFYHAPGYMTGREVMQHFGTEMVRSLNDGAWRVQCINKIITENPVYAFISDLRFVDEFAAIKNANGYCIKLLRNSETSKDAHSSENELDQIQNEFWDIIINNSEYSMIDFKQGLITEARKKNILKPEFLG
jgi:hypothetical protein